MTVLDLTQGVRQDMVYNTNDTIAFDIDVTDDAGADINFSGYTASFKIKDKDKILYEFDSSEITLTTGNVAVLIPANTISLATGKYSYMLELTVSTNVYTFLYGSFLRGQVG